MLIKVEANNPRTTMPALPLGGSTVDSNPVFIRDIDGLGPVKSDITTTPNVNMRGATVIGTSVNSRNIVMTLGLSPNWVDQTIFSLRQLLYGYFMTEEKVRLRFFTDDLPVLEIEGYTESFEPVIFSQDPEIQISIICPDPDFVDVDATEILGDVLDAGTFDVYQIDYIGNADTGFVLEVKQGGVASFNGLLSVINQSPDAEIFSLDTIVDSTQYFKINTNPGFRVVQSIDVSTGDATNLLSAIDDGSLWPQLRLGENLFDVTGAPLSGALANLDWRMVYYNRFGGL